MDAVSFQSLYVKEDCEKELLNSNIGLIKSSMTE